MNADARRPERDAAPTAADPAAADLLARYKRASLRRLALQAAWDLGALVRRVEREAPEVHWRLLDAVYVLQQLALQHGGDRAARPTPGASAPPRTGPGGAPRQGELF